MRPTTRRSDSQPACVSSRAAPLDPRRIRLLQLAKGRRERRAHAFARHLEEVQVRAARRELEEVADRTVDLLDLAGKVDHHGRRPEALCELALQQVGQIGRSPARSHAGVRGADGIRRENRSFRPSQRGVDPDGVVASEQLPALVERGEQILGAADRLARTEQQEAARIQAVVEDGQQTLLCARNRSR